MTSLINPLYPVAGSPTTQSVRDNFWSGSYVGSNDIKNYPGEIRIKSDAACTVRVNGWYFQVFSKI